MQAVHAERQSIRPKATGLLAMFAILLLLVGAAVVFILLPRLTRQKVYLAEAAVETERVPGVTVVAVKRSPPKTELELPSNLQALNEAPIYARTDGYMRARFAEIADRVKKGQLMAELDTPELDQQIRQLEAVLAQSRAAIKQLEAAQAHARANLKIATQTDERWKKLAAEGVMSRQDADEKEAILAARQADLAASEANIVAGQEAVRVNEANIARLKELKGFSRILSPFDGVVTSRLADVGALITTGVNGSREMFRVAVIDPLRVFVNVPQNYVQPIRGAKGSMGEITVEQFPGRKFPARVMRSNFALDPNARTMLTLLYVANPNAELLPGMFAQVKFKVGEAVRPLLVPGDALVSRNDGPHVAVVDASGKVHFRKIQPGRDYGAEIEVHDGVSEGELIVTNPTDEVREGATVKVRVAK